MSYPSVKFLILLSVLLLAGCKPPPPPVPTDVIWTIQGAQTTIRASKNRGAAIYSATIGSFEHVVSTINGNPLQYGWPVLGNLVQTAYSYDGLGEHNNPTEAGSAEGLPSTVIGASASGKVLTSYVHPAYFYKLPNGDTISPDTIAKRVEVDWNGITNVVRHDVTLTVAQAHQRVDIIGLVFYANPALSQLLVRVNGIWTVTPYQTDPTYNDAKAIKGFDPMIVATPDGAHALGFYGPETAYNMLALAGINGTAMMLSYSGRANNNWSYILIPCPPATLSWTVYYVFGTLDEVKAKLVQIQQ